MQDEIVKKREEGLGMLLLRMTVKYWRLIVVNVAAAAIATYIFTSPYFITPLYKAEAIIYPPSSNTSTSLINSDMRFGSDRDIDNAMQVLQSTPLRDSITRKYNLLHRYGINPSDPQQDYLLEKEYNDNISITRTRYSSIAIGVNDQSPIVAANMANDIVAMGDKVKAETIKKNLRSAYQSVEREMRTKTLQLVAMADSLNYLKQKNNRDALAQLNQHFQSKKHTVNDLRNSIDKVRTEEGIYDLDKQFNSLYTSYLEANANYISDSGMVVVMSKYYKENDTALVRRKAGMVGWRALAAGLRQKLVSLNSKGALYNSLQDRYNFEKSVLSDVQGDYEISKSTFDKEYDNLALTTMKSRYEAELDILKNLKVKYELALSNLTDLVPTSYVVSPATPSSEKVYPRRGFLTLLGALSAYLLTVVGLVAFRNFSAIKAALRD